MDESHTIFKDYYRSFQSKPAKLDRLGMNILAWYDHNCPEWSTDEKGAMIYLRWHTINACPFSTGNVLEGLQTACRIEADLSALCPLLLKSVNKKGKEFWTVKYQVGIQFGGTELKALVQWREGVGLSLF